MVSTFPTWPAEFNVFDALRLLDWMLGAAAAVPGLVL